MIKNLGLVLCTACLVCACSDDSEGEQTKALTEWQGSEPHFEVRGTLDGEELNLSMGEDASDDALLFCTREYTVPLMGTEPDYSAGSLTEVKITAFVEGQGGRFVELELKQHDYQSDKIGADVVVVQRSETENPRADEMWLEWEWHGADEETLFEGAANSGTFTLERFTGSPDDATGLVIPSGEGSVGGFARGEWKNGEALDISFSAPCTTSDVAEE